ncbi:unnamed protein product [Arctogadus glacialis]
MASVREECAREQNLCLLWHPVVPLPGTRFPQTPQSVRRKRESAVSCDGGPGDPVLRESWDSQVVWRSAALVRPAPPAHLSAVFVDGSALKDTCGSMCLHVGPGSEGRHERALELL